VIIGTWRANFGVPDVLKKAKVTERNRYVVARKIVMVTRAKRQVPCELRGVKILGHGSKKTGFYMLATDPDVKLLEVAARIPFGDGQEKPILDVNDLYNRGKIGTDVEDQLRASYPIDMRPRRWYQGVLYWGYREQTVQAYLCYREIMRGQGHRPLSHAKFLLHHAEFMRVGGPVQHLRDPVRDQRRLSIKSPIPTNGIRRGSSAGSVGMRRPNNVVNGGHYPFRGESDQGSTCVYCYRLGVRRKTVWQCRGCLSYLCPGCFEGYHEEVE
jgi:ribosomal protein L37AE/L43A